MCLKTLECKNSVSTSRYFIFTRLDLLVRQAYILAIVTGSAPLPWQISVLPGPGFKGNTKSFELNICRFIQLGFNESNASSSNLVKYNLKLTRGTVL